MKRHLTNTVIREATIEDIPPIQAVRRAVLENRLSNPSLITDQAVADYLLKRGKGWVAATRSGIAGFAIISYADNNVWALFLHPHYEGQGLGRKLHETMLNWYFSQTTVTVWLSTEPGTRAEQFYRKAGWKEIGAYGANEIKFEMTAADWFTRR